MTWRHLAVVEALLCGCFPVNDPHGAYLGPMDMYLGWDSGVAVYDFAVRIDVTEPNYGGAAELSSWYDVTMDTANASSASVRLTLEMLPVDGGFWPNDPSARTDAGNALLASVTHPVSETRASTDTVVVMRDCTGSLSCERVFRAKWNLLNASQGQVVRLSTTQSALYYLGDSKQRRKMTMTMSAADGGQ